MDKHTAAAITGLTCREFPNATFEFMRCQIGEESAVKIQTSPYRFINDTVFRLRAYGQNWEEAIDMLERRKKPQ